MMETEEEVQAELSIQETIARKNALEGLLRSAGWSILLGMLRQQADARKNRVLLQPIGAEGLETVHVQEFLKGEIASLEFVMYYPGAIVKEIERELTQHGYGGSDARRVAEYAAILTGSDEFTEG